MIIQKGKRALNKMKMKSRHTEYKNTKVLEIGDGLRLRVLLTGEETNGLQCICEDIVEPGKGPERHVHHKQDETFFFLVGDFEVEVDGVIFHAKAGDIAFVPKGSKHTWKNVGNTEGRLRYIFSPALNIDSMFQDLHDIRKGKTFEDDHFSKHYPEQESASSSL